MATIVDSTSTACFVVRFISGASRMGPVTGRWIRGDHIETLLAVAFGQGLACIFIPAVLHRPRNLVEHEYGLGVVSSISVFPSLAQAIRNSWYMYHDLSSL